jgi:phosphatidylserine/phosphatidylglycerophosphate/cardiolipin synthase-like enzyme
MTSDFEVMGQNSAAQFKLKVYRGDGMALLAMNWKNGKPPKNFVGFAIEYKEPGGTTFFALKNRLSFPGALNTNDSNRLSTLRSPIQKFRWVHFPRNANLEGKFNYRVTPVFMNEKDELSYGEAQTAEIELNRQTYKGLLNVAYTRGFVSSQAFVDRYASIAPISKLLPAKASAGLTFDQTHPKKAEALAWMGFEARETILDVLDRAVADKKAQVRVIAYDLNEPDVVSRLEKLRSRLKIIIDDDGDHGKPGSAENQAEKRLQKSAGKDNVKRQHMGNLQHNKIIVVDGPKGKSVVCGSTNFSWRGLYVQANNALVMEGQSAVKPFLDAFDNYWKYDKPADFAQTSSAKWTNLGLAGVNAKVAFSPHSASNGLLQSIADDIEGQTTSSLFYSLAFLYQTPGEVRDAIEKTTKDKTIFVYGISDKRYGGITLQKPNGNLRSVYSSALSANVPDPFKSEPTGGGGTRMHHKFIVIDFNKPSARVYLGSYNFSVAADTKNGENLVLIRDRRIAVSYAIEALSIFDHYHFRVSQQEAKTARKTLTLTKPPRKPGETAWWEEYYTDSQKKRDRDLFAQP